MDNQRDIFEATSPFAGYMNFVERMGDKYKPIHYKDLFYANIMSHGWLSWQQAQQVAVPDGFVLVKKKYIEDLSRLGKSMVDNANHYQDECHIRSFGNTVNFIHKAMIEAQEKI